MTGSSCGELVCKADKEDDYVCVATSCTAVEINCAAKSTGVESGEAGCVGEETGGDGGVYFGCLMEEGAFEVCLSVGMVN